MLPKYIDIHSHLNLHAFKEDYNEAIQRAFDEKVWTINVGTQYDTSKKAVDIASQYEEGVYAIVGLHPVHTSASYHDKEEFGESGVEFTSRGEIFEKYKYREFLNNPKVVAIGECGLDYYRCTDESIEKQRIAFIRQIELANEFDKPLMLHIRNNKDDKSRNAYKDALEILKQYSKVKSNLHFFAGGKEEVEAYLQLGCTFSFNGVITFTHDYDEVIKMIPLESIMSETDAPYVTPVPYRGKRNESSYVPLVVKRIAEIKGLDEAMVAGALVKNSRAFFKI